MLMFAGACELRTEVNIAVDDDGSGAVEFAVALDEDAARRSSELLADLAVDDLMATGWQITGPAEEADGYTWIRATHTFDEPSQLRRLVAEIAGEEGRFRDFSLTRDDSVTSSDFAFSGTVDFTGGLEALADDPELEDAVGAEPLELVDEQLGGVVDDLISVRVAVRLPGDVESNALTQASNGAVWEPSVTEREEISLSATGTVRRTERLVYASVAVVAGVALVLFLSIRLVLWRRSRSGDVGAG